MELSPSRETAKYAATQELPKIIMNSKFHYRLHKWHAFLLTSSPINLVHTTQFYLSKIHFNIIRSYTSKYSKLPLSLSLSLSLCLLVTLVPITYIQFMLHAHYHSPWLITKIKLEEEYPLWSSPLCNFLQFLVTSSLFSPNVLLSNLFPNNLSVLFH
jgi:hypothetical protein